MKLSPILSTLLLASSLSAYEGNTTSHQAGDAKTECGNSPRPVRLAVRHIEANGVGYHDGYTTIEGFLTPKYPNTWLSINDHWLPFADLRLHIFNDGKPAANAGLGMRYLARHMVWGVNAYYDYRKTSKEHYNQVALGFEGLGRIWDFRVNGYLPVGTTKTSWYGTKDLGFEGHYLMISQRREFALKGFNAEAGVHINEFKNEQGRNTFKNTPFYIAAGPYYLAGEGKTTWGAQARFTLDLCEYLRLEGNTSYDKIYHGIGQGQLTVMVPLGKQKKVYARKKESCGRALMWSERAVQRVDRNEIIPTKKKTREIPITNPATGDPFFFWFVNNTSSSLGTIESPFPTLLMAQNASSPNDVIYVFPGDGTDKGMKQGISLKDNQLFLSTSMPHTFNATQGSFTVPAMSTGMPQITNRGALTQGVVILASNNEISGMAIHDFSNKEGIVGGPTSLGGQGAMSNVLIESSLIVSDSGTGVLLYGNDDVGNVNIVNSSVTGNGFTNVYIGNNSNVDAVAISNCTISGGSETTLFLGLNDVGCTTISNSTLTGNGVGIYLIDISDMGPLNISNSTIFGGAEAITYAECSSIGSLSITNSTIESGEIGVLYESNGEVGDLAILNSSISGDEAGIFALFNESIGNIEIANSTVEGDNAIFFLGNDNVGCTNVSNSQINGSADGMLYVENEFIGPITISSGSTITASDGDGLAFEGNSFLTSLTVLNSTISATDQGITAYGEGSFSLGPVTISDSTISGGSSSSNNGILIQSFEFTDITTITNSTISGGLAGLYIQTNANVEAVSIANSSITASVGNGVIFDSNPTLSTTTITGSTLSGPAGGLQFFSSTDMDVVTISDSIFTSALGAAIDFQTISSLAATSITNCTITAAGAAGTGISFDLITTATGPTTINNCNISVPIGPRGISFTNTPNGTPPQTFTLVLHNDIVSIPPAIGYYLNNPNPLNTFNLDRQNDTGAFDLTNITIIP